MADQPLQICVFKWGTKYSRVHVERMYSMLCRNLTLPWEFVIISDDPADASLPGRYVPLWNDMRDAKLCGVRLRAFGRDMAERIGRRFAWIDLDVVITGNVDHIFGRTEPLVALRPPRPPMPINGSLVMMDAGAFSLVYETWNPEAYERAGRYLAKQYDIQAGTQSDEGWMWWTLQDRATSITRDDGVYYFRHDLRKGELPLPNAARMVVMNGRLFDPAMPHWQKKCPWIRQHWR